MITARLYILQRLTALIMAPLVIGHIAVMIYAVQNGLSAAEILGRTQGSMFWAAFYGLFALAVAIHAAIGLRAILHEWAGLDGAVLNIVCWLIALGLGGLGLQAVYSVTG
jgi:fumarate reductase subunit C